MPQLLLRWPGPLFAAHSDEKIRPAPIEFSVNTLHIISAEPNLLVHEELMLIDFGKQVFFWFEETRDYYSVSPYLIIFSWSLISFYLCGYIARKSGNRALFHYSIFNKGYHASIHKVLNLRINILLCPSQSNYSCTDRKWSVGFDPLFWRKTTYNRVCALRRGGQFSDCICNQFARADAACGTNVRSGEHRRPECGCI